MAISEIWLPRPTGVGGIGAKATAWAFDEARRLGDEVQRTLPFAWVPVAAGAVLALPVVASLNGAAQWAVLAVLATTVVWTQLASLVAWSRSDGLVGDRQDARTTAEVLRPRRKDGWKVLTAPTVGGRTVDHLAVTPGGVVVIEARHRRTLTHDDLEWAAAQAQRSRRDVLGALGPAFDAAPVVPVIVTWGSGEDAQQPTFVGGVRVVHGHDLAGWLDLFAVGRLTPLQISAAATHLAA